MMEAPYAKVQFQIYQLRDLKTRHDKVLKWPGPRLIVWPYYHLNSFTRGDNCYQLWAQETKVLIEKCLSSSSLWTGLSAPTPATHLGHLPKAQFCSFPYWEATLPWIGEIPQGLPEYGSLRPSCSLASPFCPSVYAIFPADSPAFPTSSPILLAFLKSLPTKFYLFLTSVWMCPPSGGLC